MSEPISDLKLMISGMEPVLNVGVYAYVSVPHGTDMSMVDPVVMMNETEGTTLVIPEIQAMRVSRILCKRRLS
jgi:hypothetical protein